MASITGKLNAVGNMSGGIAIDYNLGGELSRIVMDHADLTGRGEADQHPISAITGLSELTDGLTNGFILNCGSATEVI